ncbi:aminotransferase class V-fold PLP-dependent enzyme [Janthinobacterium sp.]|uniref:aminotransferase class V-fold PLP-dependent enzyme n=1 Tax=Janthinobacterium sp. TaxID=1871054 RepID=UPI00293D5826|nr:aminotransferase class V-fold PLP-dependent enzyme [Janthinobacterium sp.]
MIPEAQLAALRARTPGLNAGAHFNHAGASLLPAAALAAIHAHLALESRVGPMQAALLAAPLREQLRRDAATLLKADAEEIAFTPSGSSALGQCFAALPALRAGERILVGRQEWGGNLANYQRAAQRAGARVELIPSRADGSVDAEALAARINDGVRLISLTWLAANGGVINDAAAVGRVAKAAGVAYFIDAAQALGQLPVDVRALHCDVLAGSGRKHLRGPRGAALLYVRRGFLERLDPPWVDVFSAPYVEGAFALRADARRFETSEAAIALQLGLGAAIALALSLGPQRIAAVVARKAQALRERLAGIPGLTLRDPDGAQGHGLVTFTLRGHAAFDLKAALAQRKIYIGAHGVPFTPLDMRARGLEAVARVSLSYLNTDEDVEALLRALGALARA